MRRSVVPAQRASIRLVNRAALFHHTMTARCIAGGSRALPHTPSLPSNQREQAGRRGAPGQVHPQALPALQVVQGGGDVLLRGLPRRQPAAAAQRHGGAAAQLDVRRRLVLQRAPHDREHADAAAAGAVRGRAARVRRKHARGKCRSGVEPAGRRSSMPARLQRHQPEPAGAAAASRHPAAMITHSTAQRSAAPHPPQLELLQRHVHDQAGVQRGVGRQAGAPAAAAPRQAHRALHRDALVGVQQARVGRACGWRC